MRCCLAASLLCTIFGSPIANFLGPYGSATFVCFACFLVPAIIGWDWVNPLFLFTGHYLLSFGLYAYMSAFGRSHYLGADNPMLVHNSLACVYAAGMLFAIYAGYLWRKRENPKQINLEMLPGILRAAKLALFCAYVGALLMIRFQGGFSQIGEDPAYVATDGTTGLFWVQALIFPAQWAFVAHAFAYLRTKKSAYLKWALLSLPIFAVDFLLSGSKAGILMPFFGLLIVWHYCFRRLRWKQAAYAGLLVLLVFAAGYSYRAGSFGQGMSQYASSPVSLAETFVGRNYGTDSFAVILDAFERNAEPKRWGSTFSDLLTWYIPRSWWPNKPLSYAIQFGVDFFPKAAGAGSVFYSPSLPGEFYLDFGLVGLILGGLLFGYFLRWIAWKSINEMRWLIVYSVTALLFAAFAEGPVSSQVELIATRLIAFVSLLWVSKAVHRLLIAPGKESSMAPDKLAKGALS